MNKKNSTIVILLAIAALLLATFACTLTRPRLRVGDLQTESRSVELGGAESVRVEIDMAAGELDVTGGASKLLEADFTYNVAELKPEVAYSGGTLTILTPDVEGIGPIGDWDDYRYEWDLRFNDGVPMEMSIDLGAGDTVLKLGSLSLTRLETDTGAGNTTLDLAGASSLTRLEVKMGAGNITVDLTGDWQDDLDADIDGGVGELTLLLPSSVGVRVDVSGGITDINASGLKMDGNDYVNDAYGESAVTLRIDIQAGVGKINLELRD